jgi:glycosyltransferase involved in cell wall biosynthesis
MPVEAMACGTPVLVNDIGGAGESVLATSGGLTTSWQRSRFDDPAVVEAAMKVDMTAVESAVDTFSIASFREALGSWVGEA